jgi:hypothetical protein
MTVRSFIDTNVLIYADAADEPMKQARAIAIIQEHRLTRSPRNRENTLATEWDEGETGRLPCCRDSLVPEPRVAAAQKHFQPELSALHLRIGGDAALRVTVERGQFADRHRVRHAFQFLGTVGGRLMTHEQHPVAV